MRLRSLNALRVFDVVASLSSFSGAASQLSMSQGAVSYRIKQLEGELGFDLFDRHGQTIKLTDAGVEFRSVTSRVLREIDDATVRLRRLGRRELIVGVSTYFGSRWLLPRLTQFTTAFPDIVLRIQPTEGGSLLLGGDIDLAVVWGSCEEFEAKHELLFGSTVSPMCGSELGKAISKSGLGKDLKDLTLIHEDETGEAWRRWLDEAGLSDRAARRGPIIPDANMRVQAIIDNQGLALFDELVRSEIDRGLLVVPNAPTLSGYGYYLVANGSGSDRGQVAAMLTWLKQQASADQLNQRS
jgi:LysR family glycine cleavage system transcriptional activator